MPTFPVSVTVRGVVARFFLLSLCFLSFLLSANAQDSAPEALYGPSGYSEVWGYLLAGEESRWHPNEPLTDIAYFGAKLNPYGELVNVPDRLNLPAGEVRVHLVVACAGNPALLHLALSSSFSVRQTLLQQIAQAAVPFDGVQLDFEGIPSRDDADFWSFLRDLRPLVGSKTLSAAVPAATSATNDAYNYATLAPLVDRMIVMAYDEHWSGGPPGPVASLSWCKRVAAWSASVLDPGQLVMGVPFYGRAWTDRTLARAYRNSGVQEILSTQSVGEVSRVDGVPHFEYEETVRVQVYFEDRQSLVTRLSLYSQLGIQRVAFWRLGQEDPEFWSALRRPSASPTLEK